MMSRVLLATLIVAVVLLGPSQASAWSTPEQETAWQAFRSSLRAIKQTSLNNKDADAHARAAQDDAMVFMDLSTEDRFGSAVAGGSGAAGLVGVPSSGADEEQREDEEYGGPNGEACQLVDVDDGEYGGDGLASNVNGGAAKKKKKRCLFRNPFKKKKNPMFGNLEDPNADRGDNEFKSEAMSNMLKYTVHADEFAEDLEEFNAMTQNKRDRLWIASLAKANMAVYRQMRKYAVRPVLRTLWCGLRHYYSSRSVGPDDVNVVLDRSFLQSLMLPLIENEFLLITGARSQARYENRRKFLLGDARKRLTYKWPQDVDLGIDVMEEISEGLPRLVAVDFLTVKWKNPNKVENVTSEEGLKRVRSAIRKLHIYGDPGKRANNHTESMCDCVRNALQFDHNHEQAKIEKTKENVELANAVIGAVVNVGLVASQMASFGGSTLATIGVSLAMRALSTVHTVGSGVAGFFVAKKQFRRAVRSTMAEHWKNRLVQCKAWENPRSVDCCSLYELNHVFRQALHFYEEIQMDENEVAEYNRVIRFENDYPQQPKFLTWTVALGIVSNTAGSLRLTMGEIKNLNTEIAAIHAAQTASSSGASP